MAVGVCVPMAKKQEGRPKSERGPRRQILTLRGYEDFKAWLVDFAEHERKDVAALVDTALEELAARRHFRKPPMR